MLFLHNQKIVFLCITKTASSSIEGTLRPHAGIAFTAAPNLKHMPYRRFLQQIAPMIKRGHGLERSRYEVVCVMREPVSWVQSWYKYRSRDALKAAKGSRRLKYSGGVSFSEFVRAYCADNPPQYAQIGNQMQMVVAPNGRVGVDRIFPFENLPSFAKYLSQALGTEVELPSLNVSPTQDLALEAEAERLLRAKLADAIAFHARLRPDGVVPAGPQ